MHATIKHVGADVLCRSEGSAPPELRLDGKDAAKQLEDWASRYDAAVRAGDDAALLVIGTQMFTWLDNNKWASGWAKAPGPRELEVHVDDPSEPLARALLDAPWELLARKDGYLADDAVQLFEVARRIGIAAEPSTPRHGDLQLMFMAAAPAGVSVLDFEGEEAAILEATARLPLHLVVEESGAARFLKERLDLDGPFEALHLSCHGDVGKQGPVLALEDEVGDVALAGAGEVAGLLGDPDRTPLVFLSACRTADASEGADGSLHFEPFVRELTRAGVANTLGWDGSVFDADASAFAQSFYSELASLSRVPRAVAVARQALRRAGTADPQRGRHWHLARLYLGPKGGGALAKRGEPKRTLASARHADQFLDRVRAEVPVARREEFVGRRRQSQAVLRAFHNEAPGVLIHGMGNLGKSSLAARIASRMTRHKTVVIFRRYDALTVLDRIVSALPAAMREGVRKTWRTAVEANAETLGDALEALLEGPLADQPILLVVDDLEQILEKPEQSDLPTPVRARYLPVLSAVLSAFDQAQGDSRLLLTSRYLFTLPDGRGADLAAGLARVPLRPMVQADRKKQLRAAARAKDKSELAESDAELAARALAAAGGNPGLQAALMTPILAGEAAVAKEALGAIEEYQKTGAPPEAIRELVERGAAKDESNAIVAFFKRMAFDTYRGALTPPQARMLSAACVFSDGIAIPRTAMEAAGAAAGVKDASGALDRLQGLGLVDDWGVLYGVPHAAANPLARPLAESLEGQLTARIGAAALTLMAKAWRDEAGDVPWDPRALELARLALAAQDPDPKLLCDAAASAGRFLFDHEHQANLAHTGVLQPALARLEVMSAPPTVGLLLTACDCAERLAETDALDRAIEMLEALETTGADHASALLRVGHRRRKRGDVDGAETAFREAADAFLALEMMREWAIARSGLAGILVARGELDEALRIRTEEELPVYERLGDVLSTTLTRGEIADLLRARGERDEALRILTEVLRTLKRLGDLRSTAVIQGKIADMFVVQGDLDEALRIRIEEQLPVFERLDDVRETAVAKGKIADILLTRGDFDEALRIRTEEQLPVFERLGEVREQAVTKGKIADILLKQGEAAEALRIHTEQLAVFEQLGEVRERAVTQAKIADILTARGELDEALRIRTEEVLPVYEHLGDVRSIGMALGRIADILLAQGKLDEALALHEQRLPTARQLKDLGGVAHALFSIASLRLKRGDHEQGSIQDIHDGLAEAFALCRKEDRPDAIGAVGLLHGQVLAMGGYKKEATEVLELAERAFEKLGATGALAQARELRGMISGA